MLWAEDPAESDAWDVGLRPVRVGLVVGTADAGWASASALVAAYLAEDDRLEVGLLGDYDGNDCDDSLGCDCLMLLGRPAKRDARQSQQLEQYCLRGGAIVALGSTGGVLPDWLGVSEEFPGAIDERPVAPMLLEVEPAADACRHPVLQGVEPFMASSDPLRGPRPAGDATVLLFGHNGGLVGPVAWVRSHQRGRVFYGALANDTDFCQTGLLRLLANAVCWAVE